MRTFRCPQCPTTLSVADDMAGKKVRCPKCSTVFDVPGADAPAAPGPVQSPPPPPPLPTAITSEPSPVSWPREEDRREDERREDQRRNDRGRDDRPRDDREREDRERWDRLRDDDEDRSGRRRDRYDDEFDDRPRRHRDRYEDDGDYRDDVGRRDGRDPAWRTVQTGLNLMFIGYLVMVIAGVVGVIFAVAMGVTFARRPGGIEGAMGMMMLLCLVGLALLGGGITDLIGYIMCAYSPDSRARNFVVGSLVCNGIGAGVFLLQNFVGSAMRRGPGAVGPDAALGMTLTLLGLEMTMFLVGGILQILFLKAVSENFDNRRLAGNCRAFLSYHVTCMVAFMIVNAAIVYFTGAMVVAGPDLFAGFGRREGWLVLTLGAILFFAAVGYVIWYLILVARVRDTIGQAFARSAFDQRGY